MVCLHDLWPSSAIRTDFSQLFFPFPAFTFYSLQSLPALTTSPSSTSRFLLTTPTAVPSLPSIFLVSSSSFSSSVFIHLQILCVSSLPQTFLPKQRQKFVLKTVQFDTGGLLLSGRNDVLINLSVLRRKKKYFFLIF